MISNLLSLRQHSLWNRIPGWITALACVLAHTFPILWWFVLPILPFRSQMLWLLSGTIALSTMSWQNTTFTPPSNHKGHGMIVDQVRTANSIRSRVLLETGQHVLLRLDSNSTRLPGDSIQWEAQWDDMLPLSLPGQFDAQKWLQSQDAIANGKCIHDSLLRMGSAWNVERWSYRARESLRKLLLERMPRFEAGVLQALLVGDKSGLEKSTMQSFRDTGLIHALTVSGFHVVYIGAFAQILLSLLRFPLAIRRILLVVLLGIYLPITGASPAIQRAVFMYFLMHLTAFLQRKPPSINTLGVASSFILWIDPTSYLDIGFQLSVGATSGILLWQKKAPQWIKKSPSILQSWVLEPTWITFAASAGTLPLLVYHFQSFAPIGLLAGLLIVPLLTWALQAGMWIVVAYPLDFMSYAFAESARWCIHYSVKLTVLSSELPGAANVVGPWPMYFVILLSLSLLFLPYCRSHFRLYRPLLLSSITLWAIMPFLQVHSFHAHFLDAGQGDCTLLSFPNGKRILIDAGNASRQGSYGRDGIVPFLRTMGIDHLDALIITHPDLDHYGGALSLIKAIPVAGIWITEAARYCDKPDWELFMKELYKLDIPIHTSRGGMTMSGLGNWSLHWIYSPSTNWMEDWNETSQVIVVGDSIARLILPGDLGEQGEQLLVDSLALPHSCFLKAGHHGSRYSSQYPWLQELRPEGIILSVGRKNRYGHPSPYMITRLDSLQIPYWSTVQNGTITLEIPKHSKPLIHSMIGKGIPCHIGMKSKSRGKL